MLGVCKIKEVTMISQIKNLFIFSIISALNIAQGAECNFTLLKMNSEMFVHRIGEEVTSSPKMMEKNLNFLTPIDQRSFILDEKYNGKAFNSLVDKSTKLAQETNQSPLFEEFVQNCSSLYNNNQTKSITHQAIYMLLDNVYNIVKDSASYTHFNTHKKDEIGNLVLKKKKETKVNNKQIDKDANKAPLIKMHS